MASLPILFFSKKKKEVLAFLGSLYLKNDNSKENYAEILFGIANIKCQTDHFGENLHHH